MSIPIFILAAGESSRLGRPKQLLAFKKNYLLDHAIQVCLSSSIGKVHVVLGAHKDQILEKINLKDTSIILNENWKKGLSSSISMAINSLGNSQCSAALFILGDQPFLNKEILFSLVDKYRSTNKEIIRSAYDEGFGPPVLFGASLFTELANLSEGDGAHEVIKNHLDKLDNISFPKGNLDIDYQDDLEILRSIERE